MNVRAWEPGCVPGQDPLALLHMPHKGFKVQGLGFRVQGLGFRV